MRRLNEMGVCELSFWCLENVFMLVYSIVYFCITLNYFFVVTVRWHKESCGHVEYPCRFQNHAATLQRVIPYRVFAPLCLMECCEEHLLQLIPQCLSAAYSTLGTHPFSRLDVLIVPSNFSSLGMAR